METTIKNCHFCGGEAEILLSHYNGEKFYYIQCAKCSAEMDCSYNKDAAIIAWNERKEPNPDGYTRDSRINSREEMRVNELEPCPCCGTTIDLRITQNLEFDPGECAYQVMCVNCSLRTQPDLNVNGAIENWNRRA